MKLKGVHIKVHEDGEYTVTPLFFGKRGCTIRGSHLREKGAVLGEVVDQVLVKIPLNVRLPGLE